MDRRQLLSTIVAAGLGVAAGVVPDVWHSVSGNLPGKPSEPMAAPTPTPPPDPGYVPADQLKAAVNPIKSLRDLTPAAPPNAVALTIDDGPHPYWTPMVLDVLAEFEIPATFNMIGEQVPENTQVVQRIVAAGHQIANHTMTHPLNLPNLSAQEIEREITETHDRIAQACSVAPRFFRAPGGAWSQQVVDIAAAHKMICVHWGVDPRDWARPGAAQITGALQQAQAGDILLIHDGGGDRAQTVEALRTVLPTLKQRGFSFVAL
ncbi:polysaccharide deacetylase family protein [Actinocorallia sp. B10E7]|uniref:polysaccharide deacetylase family protein n=1 Tax=Actinocorallia sp. B10E7 TaxID=3153558 RepID=UPI00325F113F